MDVSHRKILFIKEFFFKLEKDELIRIIQALPLIKGIGMKKYLFMAELETDDDYYKEMESFMYEKQYSRFSFFVFGILFSKTNVCLLIDENEKCEFMILGPDGFESMINNEVTFNDIKFKSFVLLNLYSIVLDFFEDEKLVFPNDYVVGFLTTGQKKVLQHIKEEGLSSITIRFNDGGEPTHIEPTKSKISNEDLNKVARYLKKKNFKDIEFKIRDGKLIKYKETDIIKL
jgi:hypothetical protein